VSTDKAQRVTRGQRGPTRNEPRGKIPDEDIEAANRNITTAFQIINRVSGGQLVCPVCGASKKKVVIRDSESSGQRYWKCFKCQNHGSAVKLLQDYDGYTFPDAVNTLLGREVKRGAGARKVDVSSLPTIQVEVSFTATVDVEVYDALRSLGSVEKAKPYWALMAHISPEVVEESGSVSLEGVSRIQAELIRRFGKPRLIAAGLMKTEDSKDFWYFSERYPIMEPHLRACSEMRLDWSEYAEAARAAKAAGLEVPSAPFKPFCTDFEDDTHYHTVGMQFRPSLTQKAKLDAHTAWKKRWKGFAGPDGTELEPSEAWKQAHALAPETAGEKVDYVPKFMSLKGGGVESLVGCGLERLANLPDGQSVYNVEGFKDRLAARTMGLEAYGLPGTGAMPSSKSARVLRRHSNVLSMDGDEAGQKGREALLVHYAGLDVPARLSTGTQAGMDVADILNKRRAEEGHQCPTCDAWRAAHPQ
jgi:hypothetical protein